MLTKYSAVSEQRQSSRPSQAAIRRIRARRSAKVVLLGVGVTVVVAGLVDCPPNVAVKLVMNGVMSTGAT